MNIPEILVYMRVGNGMYQRRGGFNYIKGDIMMQRKLYNLNLISKYMLFSNVMLRGIIRIIPTSIRQYVYVHFLR